MRLAYAIIKKAAPLAVGDGCLISSTLTSHAIIITGSPYPERTRAS